MDNSTFTVREYDVITFKEQLAVVNGYRYLCKERFDELINFIEDYSTNDKGTNILDFFKITSKKGVGKVVIPANYVGLIRLSDNFTIEILPKIDFKDKTDTYSLTRQIVLKMLKVSSNLDGKIFSSAQLDTDKLNLYEIFISIYISQIELLVKQGLKSHYEPVEENLSYVKGKILAKQNIQYNLSHKERIYVSHDLYSVNRAENRLIKSALQKLLRTSLNAENIKRIKNLLQIFDEVDYSVNFEKDISLTNIDRNLKEYEKPLNWTKIILNNEGFEIFSGKTDGVAILFPMEKLYEIYVAKRIKQVYASKGRRVYTQHSSYYLFDLPRKFKLKPDILIEIGKDVILMDTKWKKLLPNPAINYGIRQADMYQMYAYAKKYSQYTDATKCPDVWVLCPIYNELRSLDEISFTADDGVKIYIHFLDLADDDCFKELVEKRID